MNSSGFLGKTRALACVGSILLPACGATSQVRPYASYLEPEPGPYTLVYEGGFYNHDYAVLFSGMPRTRSIQMVSANGMAPEAVFIDDRDGECDRAVLVVHVRARAEQPNETRATAATGREPQRDITKLHWTARRRSWSIRFGDVMLSDVRYHPTVRAVGDGTCYHFSYARSGIMVRSGLANTPDRHTPVGEFVGVANTLIALADAPERTRESIRKRLVADAQRLLKSLEARKARADEETSH